MPFSIKHFYRVTTRCECMTSVSITVSCVKTNLSKSSLAYSNSGSIFGVAKARLTFYDASTNVHGRQTLSLFETGFNWGRFAYGFFVR
ncbi:putative GMP synthase [Daphnia magna]|uniref:Putative GMP synthase n=1 Tax=Daphnia magna TaxID=35525 RepID=A0A164WLI5_9CRUS|nr:putative GMP synthase [Daphnia magna]